MFHPNTENHTSMSPKVKEWPLIVYIFRIKIMLSDKSNNFFLSKECEKYATIKY